MCYFKVPIQRAQWVQWLTLFHVTLKRMKRSFPKNLGSDAPTTSWVSVVTSELKELLFIIYEEKGITGNPKTVISLQGRQSCLILFIRFIPTGFYHQKLKSLLPQTRVLPTQMLNNTLATLPSQVPPNLAL